MPLCVLGGIAGKARNISISCSLLTRASAEHRRAVQRARAHQELSSRSAVHSDLSSLADAGSSSSSSSSSSLISGATDAHVGLSAVLGDLHRALLRLLVDLGPLVVPGPSVVAARATVAHRATPQLFGILIIVFAILIIVTTCITVALTYFQLSMEDHRWWWSSFFSGGSAYFSSLAPAVLTSLVVVVVWLHSCSATAFFIYLYSIFFFVYRSKVRVLSSAVVLSSFADLRDDKHRCTARCRACSTLATCW